MKIDCLILGQYQTNCYILRKSQNAKDCVIIDTALDDNQPTAFLTEQKLHPDAVILTHGHIDHIYGLARLREKYTDAKIYIHKLDADMLTDSDKNMSALTGISFSTNPADFLAEENDIIQHAGIKLMVIHTPGHTPGGICLYDKENNSLFSGDTLFADSVGRTDLPPFGNMDQLINSIKQKLLTLPDETKVYPGHGPQTTIEREKNYNQYLR